MSRDRPHHDHGAEPDHPMQRGVKDRLERLLAGWEEEMLSFAGRLIAVPTENPPGREYPACVEILTAELDRLGLAPDVREVPGDAPAGAPAAAPTSYVRGAYGSGRRTLYFHGHYDVVPAARPEQFASRRRGRRLSGRGSADMKGGLAAMIYAVRALAECGVEPAGRIVLLLVADEETGGARGSASLARAGVLGEEGIGMLTPEPSGGRIWNGSRGALSLRVTVKGRSAHVGTHFRGVNAFEGMVAAAQRLLELKWVVERRRTRFRITPEAARSSVLLLGGECSGGANYNAVPDRVSFSVDRRINPEEELDEERRALLAALEEVREAGVDLEVEVIQQAAPSAVGEDDELARALAASVAAATGRPPRFELCPGLLETRFYAARGIPALAYGPGRLELAHGPDEWVDVDDLRRCAVAYALTAARMLAAAG